MSKSAEFIFKESQKEFAITTCCTHITTCCTHEDIYTINLPTINKIDNIDVKCSLVIIKIPTDTKNKYYVGFWIKSSNINYICKRSKYNLYKHIEKLYPYNIESIEKFLQKIKNEILPNLKLDKIFGKLFITNSDGKKSIQKDNVCEDIFGFQYSNYEKCTVCYEQTYTQTSCSHSLCVDCWNKIKNNTCPLCRSELFMSNNNDDDNDNEDDNDILNTGFICEYDEDENDEDDEDENDEDEDDEDDEDEDVYEDIDDDNEE